MSNIGSKIIIILGITAFSVSVFALLIAFKSFTENKPIKFTGGIHGSSSSSNSGKGLAQQLFNRPDVWDAFHTILFVKSPIDQSGETGIMTHSDIIGTLFGTEETSYLGGILTDDEFKSNFDMGLELYTSDEVANYKEKKLPRHYIQSHGPSGGNLGTWIPQDVYHHGTPGFVDSNGETRSATVTSGSDGPYKQWIIGSS